MPSDRNRPLVEFFDEQAPVADKWRSRRRYYYQQLERLIAFNMTEGSSVLEVGCGTGDLLAALKPKRGVGIDFSPRMVEIASEKHPQHSFVEADAETFSLDERFDYVILADLVGYLPDVQATLANIEQVCHRRTRLIVTHQNHLWEWLLRLAVRLRLRRPQPRSSLNWLSLSDLSNILWLAGFETVRTGHRMLFPFNITLLSGFLNRFVGQLPLIRRLGIVEIIVARPMAEEVDASSVPCSVVIPAKNEKGNIEAAVRRTPRMGSGTELIFVEGGSEDGTREEIERVIAANPDREIVLVDQGDGRGKGDAVRKGFAAAKGDVLMILDSDLTVPPEELPKFFDALVSGKGEFINGCRLVYPMEKEAMRTLNALGNKFFGLAFSYLLDQRFKDTLCGTKVLAKDDYARIAAGREYFGEFDPFGDFDLIFGAAKNNLKIVELPVRYRERRYGETQIKRFRNGWVLLKMCLFALRRIKFVA